MSTLTPRQIVEELDRYIVGQNDAKRAVAVALRNRYRRAQLPPELREEVTPHNILMIGPTGVGKTEIARRLAKLVDAPFVKVEATKFTEVGYVGRDVDSIIRDLVEAALRLTRSRMEEDIRTAAERAARERLIDVLAGEQKKQPTAIEQLLGMKPKEEAEDASEGRRLRRSELAERLDAGLLERETVEMDVVERAPAQNLPGTDMSVQDMLGPLLPTKRKARRMTVAEARTVLISEEIDKLVDNDSAISEAIRRTEQDGIVFIDELDKIAGRSQSSTPDVSREGVQRDILPIVEGSTVTTKYGPVKTDHILFIAAGAFHVAKVSDLIPELQGRFPVSVTLKSLSRADFRAILTQPESAMVKQQKALLSVDGVLLSFTDEALDAIADIAFYENQTHENIGARRLHTVMEKLIEDISFNAGGVDPAVDVTIDAAYVETMLGKPADRADIAKMIM